MESEIQKHYNSDHLAEKIKTALIKAGKDLSTLKPKDLSAIDQLHTGGAVASIELFKKIQLSCDARVLDAGCGIGGSSRLIAKQFDCRVIGIDLADKFITAADFLTRCTALEHLARFQQGSILDLPFKENTFDAILCQHVLMNIKDKSRAAKEFFRVLKPEGKLILHEITKGQNNTLVFPVPWAASPDISFLEPWDLMSPIFKKQGFKTLSYSDETPGACSWWEKIKAVSQKASHAVNILGPGIVLGENVRFFGNNMHANFTNNSICLVEAVLKKRYDK